MKPFRFALEAAATVRQRIEGQALESYAQALLMQQRAVREFEAAQDKLDAVWHQLRGELGVGGPAVIMTRLLCHAEALEHERKRRAAALQQAERALHHSLQRMLAARQRREVVEKFRGRQRASHDRDVAVETQKFLDELAAQRSTPSSAGRITSDPLA